MLIYIQLVFCSPCTFSSLYVLKTFLWKWNSSPYFEGTSLYVPSYLIYYVDEWTARSCNFEFNISWYTVNSQGSSFQGLIIHLLCIGLYIQIACGCHLFLLVSVCNKSVKYFVWFLKLSLLFWKLPPLSASPSYLIFLYLTLIIYHISASVFLN